MNQPSDSSARPSPSDEAIRILVVEDEGHLAAGLKLNFELEGYLVDVAADAREAAHRLVHPEAYGAIVLDVMLPDLDGFALCRKIRDSGNFTPVIMLTARSDPEDRITGLEAGADDYMVKPFELNELLARVQSMLRRRRWEQGGARPAGGGGESGLRFGRAVVDFSSHTATVDGDPLELTRLEHDLIRYFARNPGRTLSRKELLERVWGLRDYPNTRTVDNFMARLRRYFEVDPAKPVHFVSVRGVGYRFDPGDGA